MATIRLVPSAYTLSSTSYLQISNASNMYANTDSTSYAQITHNRNRTNAYYLYVHGFNFSSVPSDAIVSSFTVKIKGVSSGLSTTSAYTVSLYNSTTAIANTSGGAVPNSVTTLTISTGSLTWDNIKNYGNNFRIRVPLRRSSQNTSGYVRIYGAEIEVNYRMPIYHNVTATLSTDNVDSIDPAGLTSVLEGDDYTLAIYAESADDFKVEDNDTDVTSSLVRHDVVPGTNTFTGIPVSFDSAKSSYDSIYTGTTNDGLAPYNSSSRLCVYVTQTEYAEGKLVYNFDCSSIPRNAIITSVSCQVGASCYSSGQYFDTKTLQLYCGDVAKGTAVNNTGNGSTSTTHNINGGSWTRAELDDIKIVEYVVRGDNTTQASFSFFGATLTVEYTLPAGNPYYWTYTLSNVTTAHTIIVGDAIIPPPDEDPDKTYYPITISSANATTDPGRGTTRVESGTSETITIYPSDPLMTLVTDNGVDISSQLVAHGGTIPDPTVTTSAGASYGFNLNSNTGYYVSANNGVDKTAAVCRVAFDLPVRCLVTISFINYAEQGYDFGVFGNVDTALNTNYYAAGSGGATITDTSYKLACNTSTYNTSSVQTLTYEIPSGEHFIDIKYSKDDATSSNNDTLQWKITSIEALEPNNYYTYTLSNINQAHSLIFIFGNVTYYFVESQTSSDCTLYPNGQMVQLPGDEYRLTVVPNNSADTVTVRDNNVDVTNQLERKEVTTEKGGVQVTVVNYIYRINNVQTGHTVNVVSAPQGLDSYIKVSSQWSKGDMLRKQDDSWGSLKYNKLYIKQNGEWVADVSTSITTTNMVFGGVLNNGE